MSSTTFLQILQLTGAFVFLAAYVTHIISVLQTRSAKNISITGWVLWLVATFILLVGGFVRQDPVVVLVELLSLVFLSVMIALLVHFRRRERTR